MLAPALKADVGLVQGVAEGRAGNAGATGLSFGFKAGRDIDPIAVMRSFISFVPGLILAHEAAVPNYIRHKNGG